jgi:ubiquinone/menaquinone biosynthesis C-methylase UbiE
MAVLKDSVVNPFATISEAYDRFRPRYPEGFFYQVFAEVGRTGKPLYRLIDIGCGTGISTRQFYEVFRHQASITGIDASPEMLRVARSGGKKKDLEYIEGLAEDLPVPTRSCSVVAACQAVQWFNRPKFYAEVERVLRPSGLLVIVQNNRAYKRSAFLADFEALLEQVSPGYDRTYREINFESEIALRDMFESHVSMHCVWYRTFDSGEFEQFTLTSSKVQAAVQNIGIGEWRRRIRALWLRHHGKSANGKIHYESQMFMFRAKKPKRSRRRQGNRVSFA